MESHKHNYSDGSVTMTIPVPIELQIGPAPRLFQDRFFEELGFADSSDNPEGYMVYFPPELQTHAYEIRATANGNPVGNFTLKVTDNISQLDASPASQETYPDPASERFEPIEGPATGEYTAAKYAITAGLPNYTEVEESDPDTYVENTLADGTVVKVPKVLPKGISFQASKDGYADSDIYELSVTVLGDVAEGTAPEIVAVPNVNYLVLHDPPGDGSYSYLNDSMKIRGMLVGVTMKVKDTEIPVYPSPWSVERNMLNFTFNEAGDSGIAEFQDMEGKGIIGYRNSTPTIAGFAFAAVVEGASGALLAAAPGPLSYALQLLKVGLTPAVIAAGDMVQYEVSPNRRLQTSAGDTLPDLMGPGKGDIYYGEGWTVGLMTKYRLSIGKDPGTGEWIPVTKQIMAYDILDRNNQYVYNVRDIERIIENLDSQIMALGDPADDTPEKAEKDRLTSARETWSGLLKKNPAYIWEKNNIKGGEESDRNREALDDFLLANGYEDGEMLIFSGGGSSFEYSRSISEANMANYSTSISVGTEGHFSNEQEVSVGFEAFGSGTTLKFKVGASASISTSQGFGRSWESGTQSEQTVGFVLADDDIGDNISTYVYEGPWGTPVFFTDPGSVTSDPWQDGTNKAVDVELELISPEDNGPFDHQSGAHYQFRVTSTGKRKLEGAGVGFVMQQMGVGNTEAAIVRFNDLSQTTVELFKGFDDPELHPSAVVAVSVYPPEKDLGRSEEKEYPVMILAVSESDYQISAGKWLRPRFADLRAPRAFVTSPYDGQRISPGVFNASKPYEIQVFSESGDVAKIQLEKRSKQPDGVWEPWQALPGMVWEDGGANTNVTVINRLERVPPRREFTFNWESAGIEALGAGEYAIRAIAEDKASRLKTDGTQEIRPNVDLDPPFVAFLVDSIKPSVLNTNPDYQARESERIYRGELSITFTDDMRADDFGDRTFSVTDLLEGNAVAGFVSYSPALRKAIFVPQVPFRPNGFYRSEIKTDVEKPDGSIEKGVHDLAGNPLDSAFMWTFRTTEAPFEPVWSITLSVENCDSKDGNNIAGVEYGALDGEDEKDARSVPTIASRLKMNFLDGGKVEFDRDIRPADGRLSYHWFFAVVNAADCSPVKIQWKPSAYLMRPERHYQLIRLIEFDSDGNVTNTIQLDPAKAPVDPNTGEIQEMDAYEYEYAGETVRHFRLDVMKADLVATIFEKGSSDWKFFSVPIIPQVADPFVNLGDDIDPLQVFWYDSKLDGYKVYPLDLGAVSLITGRGYFTRLKSSTEVDVGGASNLQSVTLTLEDAGWHAIGNPFIKPVNVADLKFSGGEYSDLPFADAVKYDGANMLEPTLYRWVADSQLDTYEPVTEGSELLPWEGYWLRTKQPNVTVTIPAPADIANAKAELPPSFQPPMMAPPALQSSPIVGPQFDLRLKLASDTSSDVSTTLGTRDNANTGRDGLDQSEPPTLGQTVAAYFDHQDWGNESGLYNTDYQPNLEVGEERIWEFTVFTDKPKADMKLSWDSPVSRVPGDIMLYIRRCETPGSGKATVTKGTGDQNMDLEWVEHAARLLEYDMREVSSVNVKSDSLVTRVIFEVRAQRFPVAPPSEIQITAGEKEIALCWKADTSEFITGYTITRQNGCASDWEEGEGTRYVLQQTQDNPVSQFIDIQVMEETDYTYQVSVRFKSGLELRSELLSARSLPVIKRTALMQSYPNPFNPEVWIPYELAEQAVVSIQIYNSLGQLIRTLDLGAQTRGRYTSKAKAAYWDGCNQTGEFAASGVYFYVLKAGDFTQARKMILIR